MRVKCFFLMLIILFGFLPLSFAQIERPIVRLIYFLPRDRHPQPDIDEKMDTLIKDVQQFYADQMEAHGFGRKTFQIETDVTGKAVVHHIVGPFTNEYYNNLSYTIVPVNREIGERFDLSKNIYFTAIDISSEILDGGGACGRAGLYLSAEWSGEEDVRKLRRVSATTLIPASGHCFNVRVAAHELGHAFGLDHDFRKDVYIMSYGGGNRVELSYCAAEWLDIHSAFDPNLLNKNEWDAESKIKMLPPRLVSPPNTIRLLFEVTDPDGLHQAQLMTPTLTGLAQGFPELLSCETLNASKNTTVEFVTTALTPNNKSVALHVIDMSGYFSTSRYYAIYVPNPLLPADVNGNGSVDVEDLVLVAASFGTVPMLGVLPNTDVNGDGKINNEDMLLVLAALEATSTSAGPSFDTQPPVTILQHWIAEAKLRNTGDATFQRGILILEQLLAALIPKETALLPNYPNPFNPETWIPYQLAKPANVSISIYAVDGTVVRNLALGHQPIGIYQDKSRAAYWDGKNEVGEPVASSVYFYTLKAGDFTATRKMLIRK